MKKNTSILFLFLIISTNLFSQVTEEWIFRYPQVTTMLDITEIIDCDKFGNLYATGRRYTGSFTGYIITIKLDANRDTIWTRYYKGQDSTKSLESTAIKVDNTGNVFVGGCIYEGSVWGPGDFILLKYSSSGELLWSRKYDGPQHHSDFITSMELDKQGNIIVTGPSLGIGNQYDYCTIKYSPDGDSLWVQRYNGPGNFYDFPYSICVDSNNNIFVTGESCNYNYYSYDYATIKYGPDGIIKWIRRYGSPSNYDDKAFDIICDDSNNVYITGSSFDLLSRSATIKYNSSGDVKWIVKNRGVAYSLGIDSLRNIYMTGYCYEYGSDLNFFTAKCSSSGHMVWERTYNSPVNDRDQAYSIAVTRSGNSYITGYSTFDINEHFTEWITIKYDTFGQLKWLKNFRNYDSSYNSPKQVILNNSKVNVAGYGDGDLVVIQYQEPIGIQPISSEVPNYFSLSQNYPNPFNPVTKIKFAIPTPLNPPFVKGGRTQSGGFVTLKIYDILGREAATLVNEQLKSGTYEVEFDGSNYPSGVYFYKLVVSGAEPLITKEFSQTRKMVLLK